MNTPVRLLAIFVLTAVIAACGGDEGPDSISSHKSLNGGNMPDCSECHTGSLDPVVSNGAGSDGKHVAHVSGKGLSCVECHLNYTDSPNHMNGVMDTTDSTVNMVSFDAPNLSGQWADDTGALTGSCSSVNCHGGDSPEWYGPASWTMPDDCTECHSSGSEIDPVSTGGTGTAGKHAAHVSSKGLSCTECHEGYASDAKHMNGQIDTADSTVQAVGFDATNPSGDWAGDTGAQTGSCENINCHGGDTLEWYQTTGWPTPAACTDCHNAAIGTRRRIFGSGGDFEANASIIAGHLTGGGDPTPAQCAICHSMESHTSGTVKLLDADTGTVMVYSAATPSTLENFCISCHDTNGMNGNMSPFVVSKTLGTIPYTAGANIKTYWTYTSNTHRNNGLTCAGTGAPNTGCHGRSGAINMHGSDKNGMLTSNMNFNMTTTTYNYNNYKLCFDCHENYSTVSKEVVLGYKATGNYDDPTTSWYPTPYYTTSIQSLFRDRYIEDPANYPGYWTDIAEYNDRVWLYNTNLPLHNFHLLGYEVILPGIDETPSLTWKYRGDAGQIGRITCTACHNVHGTSPGTVRSTYSEFGITANIGYGSDVYKSFKSPDPFDPNEPYLSRYPIGCVVSNCHAQSHPNDSYYWHTPSDE